MKSIYIHIPFCNYICSYCDFCKKYAKNQNIDHYLEMLDDEIKLYLKDNITVDTIYIGGGTPSVLNENQLEKLSKIVNKHFKLSGNYEFTMEFNPDNLEEEKLRIVKKMGVNRLSIGVQTVSDEINLENNRLHKLKDLKVGLKIASKYIENISLDFIFNLPNQEFSDIEDSIKFICDYDEYIKHISYYGLILEKNTILDTKTFTLKDEEEESTWYKFIQKELSNLGYIQYEISNYGKKGYNSIHNQVYWDNKKYFGFGLGASGYIDDLRYTNTMSLNDYYTKIKDKIKPIYIEDLITDEINLEEEIILGLRTNKGVKLDLIKNFELDLDYFLIEDNYMKIKPEFYYVSNELIITILEQIN